MAVGIISSTSKKLVSSWKFLSKSFSKTGTHQRKRSKLKTFSKPFFSCLSSRRKTVFWGRRNFFLCPLITLISQNGRAGTGLGPSPKARSQLWVHILKSISSKKSELITFLGLLSPGLKIGSKNAYLCTNQNHNQELYHEAQAMPEPKLMSPSWLEARNFRTRSNSNLQNVLQRYKRILKNEEQSGYPPRYRMATVAVKSSIRELFYWTQTSYLNQCFHPTFYVRIF